MMTACRVSSGFLLAFLLVTSCYAEDLPRLKYNDSTLTVDLGVGLWSWPLPMDYDGDGDLDLVVSCSDVPYSGMYFFENPGKADNPKGAVNTTMPIFKPGVKIGPGIRNIGVSYIDGKPHVLTPAAELTDFLKGDFKSRTKLYPREKLSVGDGRIRANQWSRLDYDGDGALDLVVGVGYWGDYGWDNAFDASGKWIRGPLRGYLYLLRNKSTNAKPDYEEPRQLTAGKKPVDVYGMPSPNFADFDADGDLDLLCGDFLDGFTYFENKGTRTQPLYAAGRELAREGTPINMHLCMIVVSAIDWDNDGDTDLVVGQEDGRVALLEHLGTIKEGMPQFADPKFFQQQADDIKFGALVTPVSFDWDGDGDEDLICGNTAGEIGFIENLGMPEVKSKANPQQTPRWAAPKLLQTDDGNPIRIMAGENGSIQGPAETKWGYTTISVADWNHDGLPDIIANSIWGKVVWYENRGTRTEPKLAPAQAVTVQWETGTTPPKPAWNWWNPTGNELATQWRTTPLVADWNGDKLNDLISLDHEGYLALYPRKRVGSQLTLLPGKHIFREVVPGSPPEKRITRPLRLNSGTAGKSGRRKLCLVDLDGDGKQDIITNSVNANFLRNVTTAADTKKGFSVFEDLGPLSTHRLAGHTTSPTIVDWNHDGIPELLIGAEDGYFYYLENARTVANLKAQKALSNH